MRCGGGNDLGSWARKRSLAANISAHVKPPGKETVVEQHFESEELPVNEEDEGTMPLTPVEAERDEPAADEDWED